jgi:AcrR family transcriptional regulator
MNEVARAAGVSRPNLYLHFSNKETLFRAALQHELDTAFTEASRRLEAPGIPLPQRVATALDAWLGRYVGSSLGADIGSLLEDNGQLEDLFAEYHDKFEELLTRSVAQTVEKPLFRDVGITPQELVVMLIALGRGLKDYAASKEEFSLGVDVAVRLAFAPFPPDSSRVGESAARDRRTV